MQNLILFLFFFPFIFLSSCHSGESSQPVAVSASADSTNIFPVTSFLKAQIRKLDTLPITPLLIISKNGKADSSWLEREAVKENALPFLSPEIDSATMHSLFVEKSFLDQSINAYTFSYDPKTKLPDSIHLVHWDVYMNPQTNSVQRIYLVKEKDSAASIITEQLTWVVDKWFSIRTILQNEKNKPQITEEKLIWDFDE